MKKGKLIIYWDYELQRGADASILGYTDGIEDYNQTEFILNYLKRYDITTCFAVLGYAAKPGDLPYHAPEQIRQMAEEGHEVGSHTHNHKRISQLSYFQLIEELEKSKKVIEKVSKTKCTAFVPPWDKPQYFLKMAFDSKPNAIIPFRFSGLTQTQICLALKKTSYQTYRTCPLTSRFNKFKLSKPFKNNDIICLPYRLSNGFGLNAKRVVRKAAEKKGLAIINAHPRGLAHPGPQNKKCFEDFIRFVKKYQDNHKISCISPSDLL